MAPGEQFHRTPASHTLPWSLSEDHAAGIQPYAALPVGGFAGLPSDLPPHLLGDVALALQRFLPFDDGSSPDSTETDVFSSDDFRIYEFKIRRCPRGRSHDWTECPYAHPGEKARRRDPRRFHYSGTPCSDFRQGGGCRRGEGCEYAHGVFETWLHPARYRTEPCKDGAACLRRVCFFAHSPKELRIVLPTSPMSPGKGGSGILLSASPTSTLVPTPISPLSDGSSPPLSPMAVDEVVGAMTKLRLSKLRSVTPFETRRGTRCSTSAARTLRTAETRDVAEEAAAGAWSLTAKLIECRRREDEEEAESAAAPDLGWVSELVKD
ncbi:zinc finger CCCH domain-containing protein 23-like [Curcuma longa]|uniref:zinc finger CCCH domain-containing protein 23-like n=1 Tax=Curcuma longa TaxID=136217 RepID=UPI003D9E44CB